MVSETTLLSTASSTLQSPQSQLLAASYFPRCVQSSSVPREPTVELKASTPPELATERLAPVPLTRRKAPQLRRVGPYLLEAKVGEGGMGVVYRARHERTQRVVAIKLQLTDDDVHARLQREGSALQRVAHPNTVAGFDCGITEDGVHYFAMEYLEGLTLADLIQRDAAQPVGRVIQILDHVAAGLGAVHRAGMVHCDIKPSNIMLCFAQGQGDIVKIIDFGLARTLDTELPSIDDDDPMVVGTPLYLAPESILNPNEIDHRADIYAFGAVGYYLLTGTHVFCTSDTFKLCQHHLGTPPPRLAERGAAHCPPVLERIILRCLAKLPGDRFPDMRSVREALRDCAFDSPWTTSDVRHWWEGYHGAAPTRRSNTLGVALPQVALH